MIKSMAYSSGMPLYEFSCKACGKDSELLVRSSDWAGSRCPHCQSTRLMKKLSVFSAAVTAGRDAGPACSGDPSACSRCCGG